MPECDQKEGKEENGNDRDHDIKHSMRISIIAHHHSNLGKKPPNTREEDYRYSVYCDESFLRKNRMNRSSVGDEFSVQKIHVLDWQSHLKIRIHSIRNLLDLACDCTHRLYQQPVILIVFVYLLEPQIHTRPGVDPYSRRSYFEDYLLVPH